MLLFMGRIELSAGIFLDYILLGGVAFKPFDISVTQIGQIYIFAAGVFAKPELFA